MDFCATVSYRVGNFNKLMRHSKLLRQFVTQGLHAIALGSMMAGGKIMQTQFARRVCGVLGDFTGDKRIHAGACHCNRPAM